MQGRFHHLRGCVEVAQLLAHDEPDEHVLVAPDDREAVVPLAAHEREQLPDRALAVAEHLEQSPHLEFDLLWVNALLQAHGRHLRDRSGEYASVFRLVQKGLLDAEQSVNRL